MTVMLPALVLAAGKSTRIASLAGGEPKPLLTVAGTPVLVRSLEWLAESGIRDVWINLHHRPERIREVIGSGDRWGLRVQYSFEPEILGTAGGWKNLESHWTGTSLVVYGDNLMRFDLDAFLDRHRSSGAEATVAVFDPDVHENTRIAGGRVTVDHRGMITGFTEGAAADATGYVNAGAYLLEPSVAARMGAGFLDFGRDVLPALAREGRAAAHVLEATGYCLGLDTPESFAVAQTLVESSRVQLT